MKYKTFTTHPEAHSFQEDLQKQNSIAIVGKVGDKFRVYWKTQDDIKNVTSLVPYTVLEAKSSLRREAFHIEAAMSEAFALRKLMKDESIYDNYESAIDAARLMADYGILNTAKDVFDFIDDTHKYDKEMQDFIRDTLNDVCDYEGEGDAKEC